eukprot:scaffold115059_cov69-Cyclotella_meneghiniana.AAC.2
MIPSNPIDFPNGSDDVCVHSSAHIGVKKAIIESSQIANKSDVLIGFKHVAGNVIHWLGSNVVSNHNGSHPFDCQVKGCHHSN